MTKPIKTTETKQASAMETDLPAELRALLEQTHPVTKKDLGELEQAVSDLDQDPDFVADYLKGLFTEDVRRALAEDGTSMNALATHLGKSRQYIGQVLAEDSKVNFTIETMSDIAVALGRHLYLRMLGPNESIQVTRVAARLKTFEPMLGFSESKRDRPSLDEGYEPVKLTAIDWEISADDEACLQS